MAYSEALQTIADSIRSSRLVSEQAQAVEHLLKTYGLLSLRLILRLSNTAYEGAGNCAAIAFLRRSITFLEDSDRILTVSFVNQTFFCDEIMNYDDQTGKKTDYR